MTTDKHEIEFREVAMPDKYAQSYSVKDQPDKYKALEIHCSCGWFFVTWSWRTVESSQEDTPTVILSNKGGKPSANYRREAWNHVRAETDAADAKGSPMELVGIIKKTRVTNEIWLVSVTGEMPDGWEPWGYGNRTNAYPWYTVEKNSNGWKTVNGPYQRKEAAYVTALERLEKGYLNGHDVDFSKDIDVETVEVPVAAIEAYFTNLKKEADNAKGVKDLVKLREKLYKAQAAAEILDQAIESVESRIIEI